MSGSCLIQKETDNLTPFFVSETFFKSQELSKLSVEKLRKKN